MTSGVAVVVVSLMVVVGGVGSAALATRQLRRVHGPAVVAAGAASFTLLILAFVILPRTVGWAFWLELLGMLVLAGTTLAAMWSGMLRMAASAVRRTGASLPRWATPLRTSLRVDGVAVHLDVGGLAIAGAAIGVDAAAASLFVWGWGLPASAVVAAVLTTCISSPAHEFGHLVIARRAGWPVVHVWIGAVNHVRFNMEDVPTPTRAVIAVTAAGPIGGAIAGLLAAALWLLVAGPVAAGAALGVGVGLSGILQVLVGGDAIGVWGGLRLLRRGVRVVVFDPAQGMRPATEVELAA